MVDKQSPVRLCKTLKKTLKRVFRSRIFLPNCPDYDSDDSDTSTLEGEDTVDEAITVLPKKEEKKDRIFYTRRRKRNGGEESVKTFANKGKSTRSYHRKGYRYANKKGFEKRSKFFFFGTTVVVSSSVSSQTTV